MRESARDTIVRLSDSETAVYVQPPLTHEETGQLVFMGIINAGQLKRSRDEQGPLSIIKPDRNQAYTLEARKDQMRRTAESVSEQLSASRGRVIYGTEVIEPTEQNSSSFPAKKFAGAVLVLAAVASGAFYLGRAGDKTTKPGAITNKERLAPSPKNFQFKMPSVTIPSFELKQTKTASPTKPHHKTKARAHKPHPKPAKKEQTPTAPHTYTAPAVTYNYSPPAPTVTHISSPTPAPAPKPTYNNSGSTTKTSGGSTVAPQPAPTGGGNVIAPDPAPANSGGTAPQPDPAPVKK